MLHRAAQIGARTIMSKPKQISADLFNSDHGTNDILSGDLLFGDATGSLFDTSQGGNDKLFGTGDQPIVYGDALYQYDYSKGGEDQIVGPDHAWYSQLYGDAQYLFEHARGGNDAITGGA